MTVERRKRVTVFFSDIVGYKIMMDRNEDEALSLLDEARHYQKPVIKKFEGEIIKEMGDGIFAIFDRTDKALHCALEIQQVLYRTGKYKLRIGIHIGEVVFRGYDIHGDTVNLAANLAKITSSGSVVLSESAVMALEGTTDATPVFLGEKEFPPLSKMQKIYAVENEFLEVPEGIGESVKVRQTFDLPVESTTFIGRQAEIDMVRNLVRANRLVTLIGSGGVGKTRLAITVLNELEGYFRDGVRFIELEGIKRREFVFKAISNALKIQEVQDSDLKTLIVNKILRKDILLLLDNCEASAEACAEIIEYVLKHTTKARILVTSRISLGLPGELAWRVPSMTYPGESLHEIGLLENIESIGLFIERAKRIDSGLKLNAHRAVSIGSICRNLDGIPLAIELAAAKLRTLDVIALSQIIKENFEISRDAGDKAMTREEIIKKSLSWSFDTLEAETKELFLRVSVFPGTFDLDSVKSVCGFDPLAADRAEELLKELDNENLVKRVAENEKGARYIMLSVVRDFALEMSSFRLGKNELTGKYFSYYKKQVIMAYDQRFDKEVFWLNWIETNLLNINLVYDFQWVGREELLEYAGFLGWFYYNKSHIREGIHRLESALVDYKNPDTFRARGIQYLGLLYGLRGDFIEASKLLYESVKIWKKLNDKYEYTLALMHAGLYTSFFDTGSGLKYLKESEENAKNVGEPGLDVRIKTHIALAYISNNQPFKAEPIINENINKAEELDLSSEILANTHLLADCALMSDNMDLAEKRYKDSLMLALDIADEVQVAWEIQGLVMALIGQGRYEKAFRINGALKFRLDELGVKKILTPYRDNKLHSLRIIAEKEIGENKILEYEDLGKKMDFKKVMNYALRDEKK